MSKDSEKAAELVDASYGDEEETDVEEILDELEEEEEVGKLRFVEEADHPAAKVDPTDGPIEYVRGPNGAMIRSK